jgi:hypothetical protein
MRARAALRLIDLHVHDGDLPRARAVLEAALTIPVDENTRRNLIVRRLALTDGPGAEALRAYLFARPAKGETPDPAEQLEHAHGVIAALPQVGLGHYLAGRILSTRHDWADAARELEAAAQLGLDEPLVARENDRLLAIAAFLAGDLAGARAAATRMVNPAQPLFVQLEGNEWLERIVHAETGALRAP